MTITAVEIARALGRPVPTPEQVAVIEAPAQPALVVAGAGSGKTDTIASRVVYLVVNGYADAGQVLGLTFTRKAVTELAQRIRTRLGALSGTSLAGPLAEDGTVAAQAGAPVVRTYHSFAGELIGEFGPLAGIDPPARVLTPTASWQLAYQVVNRWDHDLTTDYTPATVTENLLAVSGALAQHLADCDALDVALGELQDLIEQAPPGPRQSKPIHTKLAGPLKSVAGRRAILPLVRAYGEAKRAAGAMDFADQMQLAARVTASSPRVGEILRQRHRWVLLDEYQDTGHAQRVILRDIFGLGARQRGHPVMAVGDPVQSIYGWRGASAENLPRFTQDFPCADGADAPTLPLLVSFRNARAVLRAANAISEPIRRSPVSVGELRARDGADDGETTAAVLTTGDDENEWVAEQCAAIRRMARDAGRDDESMPTMAVLVRRRAAMSGIARSLRERGIPVEIVGVGGLIHEPEVADVIGILRMVVDHDSGPAAVRILTGARWRLGVADLAALARRARELHAHAGRRVGIDADPGDRGVSSGHGLATIQGAMAEAIHGEDVDDAGLVDALADPGEPSEYSAEGYRRITALSRELEWLRSRQPAPLGDTVADIERAAGLSTEVLLTESGRVHLDAFAAVVAEVARGGAGPIQLLDYLAAAVEREGGLDGATVDPAPDRVQILTIHAAKGLEWDVVAIPQLCDGVFPNTTVTTWLTDASELPPQLRGDREGLPSLAIPHEADQGEMVKLIEADRGGWKHRQADEERRVCYVGLTRARHRLLLSAHYWAADHKRPRKPGPLLLELIGEDKPIPHWTYRATEPSAGDGNPMRDHPITGQWPVDPLHEHRDAVAAGAEAVRRAQDAGQVLVADDIEGPDRWARDVAALLAERQQRRERAAATRVALPDSMSVSQLVHLAGDRDGFARTLHRPVPRAPAPQARLGSAFHAWLEQRFAREPLIDLTAIPGAHDEQLESDDELARLVALFEQSEWAARTPIAVEVPFVTRVGAQTVRGRMDAVFKDSDGYTVVDWKTGRVPPRENSAAVGVQLAAYRLAWSRLHDVPVERVKALFYYVSAGRTVVPDTDPSELDELVAGVDIDRG